jgi:hypothetical protein
MCDFACYVISVESLVPDAPGRMEAGHVPVILHGGGKADRLSGGASGEWTLLLFARTATLLSCLPSSCRLFSIYSVPQ